MNDVMHQIIMGLVVMGGFLFIVAFFCFCVYLAFRRAATGYSLWEDHWRQIAKENAGVKPAAREVEEAEEVEEPFMPLWREMVRVLNVRCKYHSRWRNRRGGR